MKRTALRRKTPLRAKGRERGTPMPALRHFIRRQYCALLGYGGCGLNAKPDAAHLPRVKAHGDIRNLIPLCRAHHMEQHRIGVQSFAARYSLDLQQLADWYWDRYQETEPR